MTIQSFPEQFAAKAARVQTDRTSTTNWNGVRDLIAEQAGLQPKQVYVATISKPGNVGPRFFQSKGALKASLLVAMHTDDPERIPQTVAAMKGVAVERGVSAVVAVREGGTWSVVVILRPSEDGNLDRLAGWFPEAVVLPV